MRRAATIWVWVALLGCGTAGRNGGTGGGGGSAGSGGGGSAGSGGGGSGGGGSGGGGQQPPPMVNDLLVTPGSQMFDVDGTSHPTATYSVKRMDGTDVTAQAVLTTVDPLIGTFAGATLTLAGDHGAVTSVKAVVGNEYGLAALTVKLHKIVIGPGAPSDGPTQFGGPATGSAATMVYPADGVLVPPNLSELELQFNPPAGATLYEVGLQGPALDMKIYTPCVTLGSGCGYLPDETTWKLLSEASASTTVDLTLRSTSGAGKPVGAIAPQKLSFADANVDGGLYYWAAASGSIMRYDFGLRGQKAEKWYTAAMAGATCVGCHVLSRDGTRVAVGLNVPGPAELRTLDVATRKTLYDSGGIGAGGPPMGGSNFEAVSFDGTKALVNAGNDLALIDVANGMSIAAPALTNADMPDWSPDSSTVVFARGSGCPPIIGCGSTPGVSAASLLLSKVNGTTFAAATPLVTASGSDNNYYPSFSPDGVYVAFNRSGMQSYDAPDARVMVVPTAGGAAIDLAVNATVGNSWPKFAPLAAHFQGDTIYWLTFASRRDYGLRLQQSGKMQKDQIAQLWMVAVSPKRLMAGDRGYPAFWLPFQDMSTGNHIAQWTQAVKRAPCTPGDSTQCMPGEVCVGGVCVPQIQ